MRIVNGTSTLGTIYRLPLKQIVLEFRGVLHLLRWRARFSISFSINLFNCLFSTDLWNKREAKKCFKRWSMVVDGVMIVFREHIKWFQLNNSFDCDFYWKKNRQSSFTAHDSKHGKSRVLATQTCNFSCLAETLRGALVVLLIETNYYFLYIPKSCRFSIWYSHAQCPFPCFFTVLHVCSNDLSHCAIV